MIIDQCITHKNCLLSSGILIFIIYLKILNEFNEIAFNVKLDLFRRDKSLCDRSVLYHSVTQERREMVTTKRNNIFAWRLRVLGTLYILHTTCRCYLLLFCVLTFPVFPPILCLVQKILNFGSIFKLFLVLQAFISDDVSSICCSSAIKIMHLKCSILNHF